MRAQAARLAVAAAIAAGSVACSTDAPPVEPPPMPVEIPELVSLSVEPLVLWRDGGSARLMATLSGPGVADLRALHIEIRSTYAVNPDTTLPVQALLQDGVPVTRIALYDDGTGGDAVAGDGTFTSRGIVPHEEPRTPIASLFPMYVPGLAWEFADTVVEVPREPANRIRVVLYDADPEQIAVPPIAETGPDVQRTPHVIALAIARAAERFAGATLDGYEVAQAYYERFDYDPDFLETFQPGARIVGGAEGAYYGASSAVTGIGSPPFDRTGDYGSGGRLTGVIVVRGGPHPALRGLSIHELLHGWAAFLDPALGLTVSPHWSRTLDRAFSGFTDGRYNDLELYLLGLVPADSVVPRQIGTNGVTIDDVIAANGVRGPAWPRAQTEFTLATVIVHHRRLEPAELALFDFIAAEFARESTHPLNVHPAAVTFFEATGGRARLITRIPDDAAR